MRMIITGGSGFMGTNAVEYFKNKGYGVLSIDIKPPRDKNHRPFWKKCDILDAASLKRIFQNFQPDLLLHLAARTDLKEKKRLQGYAANIDGVRNVIAAANATERLKRILFASSRMVCRIDYQPKNETDVCPPNLYGESKVLTEQIIRSASIKSEWVIVRPTSIWGPWFDIPYKTFFTTIARRMYFKISGFNPLKSFGFVLNTMDQIDKLFQAPSDVVDEKTLYLCDYPPLEVNHWADLIRRRMNLPPIHTVLWYLLKLGAFLGDFLSILGFDRFPITTFRLNNLVTDMVYDTILLESICGSLPFSLEQGVNMTVKWMNDQT